MDIILLQCDYVMYATFNENNIKLISLELKEKDCHSHTDTHTGKKIRKTFRSWYINVLIF